MNVRKSRAHEVVRVGTSYKPGSEQAQLFADIAEWAESAEPVAEPASAEDVREITELFALVPEGQARKTLKQQFAKAFAVPSRLSVDQVEVAKAWLEERLKGVEDDKPAPAKKASKRGKARTKKSDDSGAEGGPVEESAADTHLDYAEPQDGDTGEGPLGRGALISALLATSGVQNEAARRVLQDAGLWPVADLSTDAQVKEASALLGDIDKASENQLAEWAKNGKAA